MKDGMRSPTLPRRDDPPVGDDTATATPPRSVP
jgi:hypothetical protein